ncbi:MAG: hypothetical protein PHE51_06830 [Eubacteriales bacterium]|nr:hypothetical protein [Eubacteriales bacterium]
MDLLICLICGYTYTTSMKDEYNSVGESIVGTIANSIDREDVDLWLSGGENSEYEEVLRQLVLIRESALDIEVLQVYRMNYNNMTVVFDANNHVRGENIAYPQPLYQVMERLKIGQDVATVFTNNPPAIINFAIINSESPPIYAISKINMSAMYTERDAFVKKVFFIITLSSILLILISSIYMDRLLIVPLNKIEETLRRFAEDNTTGDETKKALDEIKDHNIKEIYEIKENSMVICEDVGIKANEIKELDQKIIQKMQVIIKEFEDEEIK